MKKETPISLRHLRRITAILLLCPINYEKVINLINVAIIH